MLEAPLSSKRKGKKGTKTSSTLLNCATSIFSRKKRRVLIHLISKEGKTNRRLSINQCCPLLRRRRGKKKDVHTEYRFLLLRR